jgi:hypothetical protein
LFQVDGDADGDHDADIRPDADTDDDADGDADLCSGPDTDGDGIPDSCDPCSFDGPAAPPIVLPATNGTITISRVSLDGGGNVAICEPGESLSLELTYQISDCQCGTCRDQIEIGLVPGLGHQYCAYDGTPQCAGDSGTDSGTIDAPSERGEYSIRFGLRQDYGCFAAHSTWWLGAPPDAQTIGAICVR